MRLFEAVEAVFGIKHSLDVVITSKVEESHILHGQNDTTLDFFFSSDRSVSSVVSFSHGGKRHILGDVQTLCPSFKKLHVKASFFKDL